MVNTNFALIVNESVKKLEASPSQLKIEEVCDEVPETEESNDVKH